MPTNTPGSTARSYGGIPVVNYIARSISYTDLNIGATDELIVGKIPAGSLILRCKVVVTTGFDDTNGDDLDVGLSAGAAELGSAMDINSAAIDEGDLAAADLDDALSSDITVYAAPTTAASGDGTAGQAYVIVEYIPVVQ